ncbi:MAG: glycine--tRNA ligase subunit beta [Candidatus Aminicenantes bacterium]|nr:glycine--tRNA ligase subunit beta [Candidatus Aminicenantes bacterium]
MEFLLEIFTEEMPSSHIKAGLAQLKERLGRTLQVSRIDCPLLETFGTCRRLVVVGDFGSRQKDSEVVVVGPPRDVAFAADGSPTPAARGFAKSQNVSLESLEVLKTPKGEYVGFKRTSHGQATGEILSEALPGIISSLSFPKMMRWGNVNFRFSRPVRNILALWDGRVLPFSIHGIASNDRVRGHKLRSPQSFRVKSIREYQAGLKRNKVILSAEDRKRLILGQIRRRLGALKAQIFPDDALLEKLAYDVEFPYVFRGDFPREYLRLPLEVLSAAMREGQSLFSVVRESRQLPLFLGVADTLNDPKRLIRRGNERVLKARLEDARFFWEQDLKMPLAQRAGELKHVVFQEKLGSYEDKRVRLRLMAAYFCDRLDENKLKKEAVQAADLCKVDLLTEMVREFPGLQGIVGGLYAKEEGYPPAVCQAVYEHYRPVGFEDSLPSSLAGALLSLSDKIDSIVGAVGIGIRVTGSSDSFGLRRQANGVCRIILARKLNLALAPLLERAVSAYGDILKRPKHEIVEDVRILVEQRLRFIYESQGYRYDLVGAVLGAGFDNIYHSHLRLKALDALKKRRHFEPFILMARRVNNILRDSPSYPVNEDLLADQEEKDLWSTLAIVSDHALPLIRAGDFAEAQNLIFRLQPSLNAFFDKVLVMAEDKALRRNRLGLLARIRQLLLLIADWSQIVIEGERKETPA